MNHLFTDKQLIVIDYCLEDLKNTIHALNPNKSHGPDNLSVHMLHICVDPILAPLDLIFRNITLTGIPDPDPWKLANVTPVHKKDGKQLTKKIGQYPFCANMRQAI